LFKSLSVDTFYTAISRGNAAAKTKVPIYTIENYVVESKEENRAHTGLRYLVAGKPVKQEEEKARREWGKSRGREGRKQEEEESKEKWNIFEQSFWSFCSIYV